MATTIKLERSSHILRNFVILCFRSWIVHSSRKRRAFKLFYSTSNFCITNQVLVSIKLGNLNSSILGHFVLLLCQSWTVHNLHKREALQLPYSTSKSCVINQVLVSISIGNHNSPILHNFVLLRAQSWIVHNLRKSGVFKLSYSTSKFHVTSQVLASISLGNFNSSILENSVLSCSRSWIVHNLRKRGMFKLSHSTSKFCFIYQELVSISTSNCDSAS